MVGKKKKTPTNQMPPGIDSKPAPTTEWLSINRP